MPRDIPVGNGNLLVCFDHDYAIRDLYYPHVGQENHMGGHRSCCGVWVGGRFAWVGPGWEIDLRYETDTLVTRVRLFRNSALRPPRSDTVDFHENIFLREITVENMLSYEREIRIFFVQDFSISGNSVGDTAAFDPETGGLVHYKGARYFLANAWVPGMDGLSQFAAGQKEGGGREGTWRDAEDGILSGNPIAQGSVDSVIGLTLSLAGVCEAPHTTGWQPGRVGRRCAARCPAQAKPAGLIRRTADYWSLWGRKETPPWRLAGKGGGTLPAKPPRAPHPDRRRRWNSGGQRFGRHPVQPRYLLLRLAAGRRARRQCPRPGRVPGRAPELLPLYRRGSQAGRLSPSQVQPGRHPGLLLAPLVHGRETRSCRSRKTRPPWSSGRSGTTSSSTAISNSSSPSTSRSSRTPRTSCAATATAATGLPAPSYDLWEERRGIHSFTVGAVFGGLTAASLFCTVFGETERADRYRKVAAEIRDAATTHLWREDLGRFCRMVSFNDKEELVVDETCDSSLWGLFAFGLYTASDPRLTATFDVLRERLWVRTEIGGMARYEEDVFYRVSPDLPGNPWFVATLWLADYLVSRAASEEEMAEAITILDWAAEHALPSGVLAEQVDPFTGAPLSVSPLTWSHATFIATVQRLVRRLARLRECPACGLPMTAESRREDWLEKMFGEACDAIHGICRV